MSFPVLVTGGAGQVARALEAAAPAHGLAVQRVGRPDFDFDRPDSVAAAFAAAAPALVVNAAAYTAVDAAETDADAATRANAQGPAILAQLCAQAGVPLIHISTDYVFDGRRAAPYFETDPVSPQGVYGRTKLAGERAVLDSGARAVILRTAWVYSATGRNFVRTMLGAARKTRTLRVVADQRGNPTAAADLAAAILAIAARIRDTGWDGRFAGIHHAAGTGWTTWHGLALAIFDAAARHGAPPPLVEPIATADWPTAAMRPPDSRLDCSRLHQVFGLRLPPWQDSLAATVDAIHRAEPALVAPPASL